MLSAMGPEMVIVQGDTSSALAGTLAAALADIPVAHVEAGLRSHDRRRPWPEEEFRVAIDEQSDLLFAPTELSAANLRREKVRGSIHITGNTGIDAMLRARRLPQPTRGANDDLRRLLVTCHRRESWGEGIGRIADALGRIANDGIARPEVILHPNPAVASQMREALPECVAVRPPCSHSELIQAMAAADLVLSDSGGMQEEAAALGVPLLVLRDRTERPEAIACGGMAIAGTDPDTIVDTVRRFFSGTGVALVFGSNALPYGDGRASERIAAIVDQWLEHRADLRRHSQAADAAAPSLMRRAS